MFELKRIYEPPSAQDGYRVLVDRLWPRGITRAAAKIDMWAKELTPSNGLRKWFHDHPSQTEQFAHRYREELSDSIESGAIDIRSLQRQSRVTLVTATKDLNRGHAAVLSEFLEATLRLKDI